MVTIFVEYPRSQLRPHRVVRVGNANTQRGIWRLAAGGGETSYGETWRSFIAGTAQELMEIGAYAVNGRRWVYRDNLGREVACREVKL